MVNTYRECCRNIVATDDRNACLIQLIDNYQVSGPDKYALSIRAFQFTGFESKKLHKREYNSVYLMYTDIIVSSRVH